MIIFLSVITISNSNTKLQVQVYCKGEGFFRIFNPGNCFCCQHLQRRGAWEVSKASTYNNLRKFLMCLFSCQFPSLPLPITHWSWVCGHCLVSSNQNTRAQQSWLGSIMPCSYTELFKDFQAIQLAVYKIIAIAFPSIHKEELRGTTFTLINIYSPSNTHWHVTLLHSYFILHYWLLRQSIM